MKSKAYSARNVNTVDFQEVVRGRDGEAAVIGIDVSKAQLKVILRWPDGSMQRPWDADNPGQIRQLVQGLQQLSLGRTLTVALEPTGTYGDALRQALFDAGLSVHWVNPKASHDYAEIFDGTPSQHDGKDAAIVAELCAIGKSRPWPWQARSQQEEELAEQVQEIDAQRCIFKLWCGKLEGLLARHWPEVLSLLRPSSAMLMRALIQYGSPAELAADPQAQLTLRRWGGSKLSPEKLEAILASARQTVGVRVSPVQRRRLQRIATAAWEAHLAGDRAAAQLKKLAQDHPALQAMGSAVGVPTACVLWVCVGNPRDYGCSEAYQKAAGLNLKERSSGRYKGKLKISKRGSSVARRWLYMAALRSVRQHPDIRRWYERARVRAEAAGGLEHRTGALTALVGVMRRLSRAVHRLAISGERFKARQLFPG